MTASAEKTPNLDELGSVLFARAVKASDFRVIKGTDTTMTAEDGAGALLDSMDRMGIVVDGKLQDPNRS